MTNDNDNNGTTFPEPADILNPTTHHVAHSAAKQVLAMSEQGTTWHHALTCAIGSKGELLIAFDGPAASIDFGAALLLIKFAERKLERMMNEVEEAQKPKPSPILNIYDAIPKRGGR